MNPDLQRLEKENAHLLIIVHDRLEKIRRLERESELYRDALRYVAGLDTSQDASPAQCSAVLVAMEALHSCNSDPLKSQISNLQFP